jgi:hypothetical protein
MVITFLSCLRSPEAQYIPEIQDQIEACRHKSLLFALPFLLLVP